MHVYHYAAYEVVGAEAAHVRVRHARGGARRAAARRGLRRPVQGRLAGAATLARALRAQAGRDVLLRAHADLRAGDDSIVLYEDWLERRDPQILDDIAAYNEEDCVSTLELRDWLLPLRPGAGAASPSRARAARARPTTRRRPRSSAPGAARRAARRSATTIADADRPRWLLAQLLLYHRREAKPVWWAFFDRIGRTSEELQERDSDAIGGLEPDGPADRLRELARLAVHVPRAAAPPRTGRRASTTRRPASRPGRSRSSTTRPARSAAARARSLADVPLPDVADARTARTRRRSSRRRCGDSPRSVLAGDRARIRRAQVDPRARAVPGAAPAGRPRRGEAARRRSRRAAPLHPGAARARGRPTPARG